MLITDWKKVLAQAWSIKFIILAGILSGIEVVLPFFQPNIPRGLFAILTMVTTLAAVIARLWAQPRMHDGRQQ